MAQPAKRDLNPALGASDGGSDNHGLEPRVARLEEDMREVKDILKNQILPFLVRIDATLPYLATKEDVASVRTELKSEIAAVKGELKSEIAEVRIDLGNRIGKVEAELGAKISEVRGMILRTPTTLQLGGFVVAIFVASGLIRWVFGL